MKKRGRGIGCSYYGVGHGFGRADCSSAYIEMTPTGEVTLFSGSCDMGQGIRTGLIQIAAEELGVPSESIRVVRSDTDLTPDAGPANASRQTFISGMAVKKAAADLKAGLLETASHLVGLPIGDLSLARNHLVSRTGEVLMPLPELARRRCEEGYLLLGRGVHRVTTDLVDHDTGQGDAYACIIYSTHIADVEVDLDTGEVAVLSIIAAHDVGKAINPLNVEGQIEGGAAMGIGYALFENVPFVNGGAAVSGFSEYILPTAVDMPEILSEIIEVPHPEGPFGAKGCGEAASIPAAPAILNAIFDATGVRIRNLPVSPEEILRQLGAM